MLSSGSELPLPLLVLPVLVLGDLMAFLELELSMRFFHGVESAVNVVEAFVFLPRGCRAVRWYGVPPPRCRKL